MGIYLSAAEYPAVRGAIDISLDQKALPDEVLALPQYAGDAERWIIGQNPLAATYEAGTDEYLGMQVAAIYACAALVLPAVPNLTSESYGAGYRYTRKELDTATLVESLWQRASNAIKAVTGVVAPSAGRIPTRFIFTVATGRRGA